MRIAVQAWANWRRHQLLTSDCGPGEQTGRAPGMSDDADDRLWLRQEPSGMDFRSTQVLAVRLAQAGP
jgi:hypothetical protein